MGTKYPRSTAQHNEAAGVGRMAILYKTNRDDQQAGPVHLQGWNPTRQNVAARHVVCGLRMRRRGRPQRLRAPRVSCSPQP